MHDLDDVEYIDQGSDDAGIAFGLTEIVFHRWWKSIPQEYRDEFVTIHHGTPQGDLALPRFVCALDHLLIQQNKAQTAGILMDAWRLATGANAHDKETGVAAAAAWAHDGVQQLLFRIRDQQSRQAVARIERLVTSNLETDLLSTEPKTRSEAMKSSLAFMRLIEDRETREREARTKRGLDRLRSDLEKTQTAFERPTTEQALQYTRALVDLFGPAEFGRILQQALPSESK